MFNFRGVRGTHENFLTLKISQITVKYVVIHNMLMELTGAEEATKTWEGGGQIIDHHNM